MKSYHRVGCFGLACLALAWMPPLTAEDFMVPKKLPVFVDKVLRVFVRETPALADAVKAQNAEGLTLSLIRERDRAWRDAPGLTPFIWQLLRNDCAYALTDLESRYPFIHESLVMDNQGALVCLSHKTSDYWQGDEAKFEQPYAGRNVYYAPVELDLSTGTRLLQVSLPLSAGKKTIGVVTFGINLERWEQRQSGAGHD